MHFNGVLTDANGNPQQPGPPLDMTFRLFDDLEYGTILWEETQTVNVRYGGVFNVQLGSVNPLTADIFEAAVWLEIQVDDDLAMTPRQELAHVPYAFNAARAEHAQNSEHAQNAANAARAQGLDCVGCVSEKELSFDPLTQQEFEALEVQAALNRFQAEAACSNQAGSECLGNLVPTVPVGKLLVIEQVSLQGSTITGQALEAAIKTTVGQVDAHHWLTPRLLHPDIPAEDRIWQAIQSTLLYADPGSSIGLQCRSDTLVNCSVTVSGYLVDVADAPTPFHAEMNCIPSSSGPPVCTSADPPDSHILVIQHISAVVRLGALDFVRNLGVQTCVRDICAWHWLHPWRLTGRFSDGEGVGLVSNHEVLIYHDDVLDQPVGFTCDSGNCRATVSGYLVPLPPSP
jgi:hypothetical protein